MTTPPGATSRTKLGITPEEVTKRVHELHEFNPMLGHRGCRLGISFPEITEMQARAIFEAAAEVQKKGIKVNPEVMIPLVGFKKELDLQVEIIHRVAEGSAGREEGEDQLPRRHDDRSARAAPSPPMRSPQTARVLLLRHQRSDPDHARHEPRRFRLVPPALRRSSRS